MIMRMQCNTHHGPVEKVQIICYVERILHGDEPSVRGTQPRARHSPGLGTRPGARRRPRGGGHARCPAEGAGCRVPAGGAE